MVRTKNDGNTTITRGGKMVKMHAQIIGCCDFFSESLCRYRIQQSFFTLLLSVYGPFVGIYITMERQDGGNEDNNYSLFGA